MTNVMLNSFFKNLLKVVNKCFKSILKLAKAPTFNLRSCAEKILESKTCNFNRSYGDGRLHRGIQCNALHELNICTMRTPAHLFKKRDFDYLGY